MSNINREIPFNKLKRLLDFILDQVFKERLNTTMPGIIQEYDATTRRARVQPAIKIRMTGGKPSISRPLLLNVPVVHPAGGGWNVHLPLRRGDPVLLVFSQRDLRLFKRTFREYEPDVGRFFELSDSIAVPGFGALSITPKTTTGLSVQNDDASVSLIMESGRIQMEAADIMMTGDVTMVGNVRASSGVLTHNGTNVGDDHTHQYTAPQHAAGAAPTSGPS